VVLFAPVEVINMDKVERLKQWMFDHQITAAALACKVGCTPPVVSYILTGKRPMSADMELRLKKVGVRL
jgi:plasmid maintenance system antidote protein VapI